MKCEYKVKILWNALFCPVSLTVTLWFLVVPRGSSWFPYKNPLLALTSSWSNPCCVSFPFWPFFLSNTLTQSSLLLSSFSSTLFPPLLLPPPPSDPPTLQQMSQPAPALTCAPATCRRPPWCPAAWIRRPPLSPAPPPPPSPSPSLGSSHTTAVSAPSFPPCLPRSLPHCMQQKSAWSIKNIC